MMEPKQNYEKRHKPRHAIKYVFFNAETGDVEFEYGGFKEAMVLKNLDG